jgi:transcriptional regulator with XRE-family HTH domain
MTAPEKKTAGKSAMRSNFGTTLEQTLRAADMKQTDICDLIGTSRAYVSGIVTGSKSVTASTVDKIADALKADEATRVKMHRAAAIDQGFKLDLPDDF